ncbi:MAG: DNA polymerase III subunit delta [Candidatus Obscuribacterales bacterium]|jgi:DNA polymerase-3 subunit delta|nr:DNA polymerase III subunit delta [Candidatus Obscuribacterales bacterium]
MPTIILSGDEELLISERLEVLKEKLLDPAWASFNFSRISHPDLKEVIDGAAAVPFGPGNKVIVFDNCDLFTKKRSGKSDDDSSSSKGSKSKSEKLLDDLDKALAHLAPNTYLIFSCPFNFDKTLKVSKIFEKHVEAIENFEKIKYWPGSTNSEMLNWARKRAHKFGVVIEDDAIDYLAESTEANLRMIAKEIEKTATYILPEKTITLEIISQMSPHFSNVFALLDHWISGDRKQVLSGIQELLSKQQSAIPVFAVVQTTITKWLSIKTAAERVLASLPAGRGIQRRELPVSDMAKRLQSEIKMNPWVLKMDLERVHKVELEYLVKKKQELTRLEKSVKTGLLPDVHALSIFFSS